MANDQHPKPLDRLLMPVDVVVQQVISHIDLNAVLEQIDMNAILERIDLEAVVERSVRRVSRRTLDAAQDEAARLDGWTTGIVDRVLRRAPDWRPLRPSAGPKIDDASQTA
jgi:hypothetical protein